MSTQGPVSKAQQPIPFPQKPIPPKLREVEGGKIVARLQYVRDHYQVISPDTIYLLINPSEVRTTAKTQFESTVHLLEWIRNVIIFLPIILTWLSLGVASSAYAELIHLYPRVAAQPFLQLWVDGFPPLTSVSVGFLQVPVRIFTFGNVAFTVFLLLVVILLLTFIIRQFEIRAEREATKLSSYLDEEIYEIGRESQVRPLGQPSDAIAQLNKTINVLQSTLIPLAEAQDRTTDQLFVNSAKQEEMIKALISISEKVAQVNSDTLRGAQEEIDRLTKLHLQTQELLDRFLRHEDHPKTFRSREEVEMGSQIGQHAQLSAFALARAELEKDNSAIVGQTYSVQVGVSRIKPESFEGRPLDIPVHDADKPLPIDILLHPSENIELTTSWQKYLLYDLRNMEPQFIEFSFRAVAPGHSSLAIDFYTERRWLRTIRLEFEAVQQLQVSTVFP